MPRPAGRAQSIISTLTNGLAATDVGVIHNFSTEKSTGKGAQKGALRGAFYVQFLRRRNQLSVSGAYHYGCHGVNYLTMPRPWQLFCRGDVFSTCHERLNPCLRAC